MCKRIAHCCDLLGAAPDDQDDGASDSDSSSSALAAGEMHSLMHCADGMQSELQEPPQEVGDCVRIVGYPSKSHALVLGDRGGETVLIFRSDSNGEDLEG